MIIFYSWEESERIWRSESWDFQTLGNIHNLILIHDDCTSESKNSYTSHPRNNVNLKYSRCIFSCIIWWYHMHLWMTGNQHSSTFWPKVLLQQKIFPFVPSTLMKISIISDDHLLLLFIWYLWVVLLIHHQMNACIVMQEWLFEILLRWLKYQNAFRDWNLIADMMFFFCHIQIRRVPVPDPRFDFLVEYFSPVRYGLIWVTINGLITRGDHLLITCCILLLLLLLLTLNHEYQKYWRIQNWWTVSWRVGYT